MLRIHGNKFKHLAGLSYAGLAGSSAAFLLILAAMLFAPAASQPEASATDDNSGISTYAATPTVGISLPTSIDFADVLPTPSGATTTATADLTITTTDSAGYSLYLYSSDGDNSLRPKISALANIFQINATAGDVGLTLSSLKPNTWGYNLGTEAPTDTTTYSAVPTNNSTPIQTKDTSDTNSANDTYTLSFGAKVDTTTASGAYSDTLTIAIVAEPSAIKTFDGITTMQEMTSTICDNAYLNETARLQDTRDGKLYWVAKLEDGNCWMTQNLDLDLDTGKALTPKDSDVTNNWEPGMSTETSGTITNTTSYTGTYSWDLGMYVKTDPDIFAKTCDKVTSLEGCEAWQNVSGMTPMTEVRFDAVTVSGNNYDAHYLVGNYYQWNAATAGTGNTIINTNATGSICPKGWRLPTGESSGEFQTLLGINGSMVSSDALHPYYFFLAGRILSGVLSYANADGGHWSSTAESSANYAYSYYVYTSGVAPLDDDVFYRRYIGYSVRCIAR